MLNVRFELYHSREIFQLWIFRISLLWCSLEGTIAFPCIGISKECLFLRWDKEVTYLLPTAACFRSDRHKRNNETTIATPHNRIEPDIVSLSPSQSIISQHTQVPKTLTIFQRYAHYMATAKAARVRIAKSREKLRSGQSPCRLKIGGAGNYEHCKLVKLSRDRSSVWKRWLA